MSQNSRNRKQAIAYVTCRNAHSHIAQVWTNSARPVTVTQHNSLLSLLDVVQGGVSRYTEDTGGVRDRSEV